MDYISGEILTSDGFNSGYIGFEKNSIFEVGRGKPPKKPIYKGFVVPTFVNAHTHIGDSFIKKKQIRLPRNIKKLVGPPNGLKHKLLNKVSDFEIIKGMNDSINQMLISGTTIFCDFRENGIKGINQLNRATRKTNISPIVMSRPKNLEYSSDEIETLLKESDGIGISSLLDWEYSILEKIAKRTRNKGKKFAIHVSERTRENIDLILDLKPDFIIHMVKATHSDLQQVKEANIPVVVCPRSNAFFGLKSNIDLIKNTGIEIMIGTDNAMLNNPNILDEIKYIKTISKKLSTRDILKIITIEARKALNLDCNILCPNSPSNFVVLDGKNLETLYISVNNKEG